MSKSSKNQILKNKKNKYLVLMASIKMAAATLLSRILGLVREQCMAYYFGASGITDAFLVAYRIPNLLRDLLAEGAFSSAFVPTFIQEKLKSKEQANDLLWSLFVVMGMITFILSAIPFLFAPQFVELFAPSFADAPQKFIISVGLLRIMSFYLFFVSMAALFMGVLNSIKIFFVPSLGPATFNITTIACMLLLPDWLKSRGLPEVYALGLGVIAGGLFQALIQVPILIQNGFTPVWPKKIFDNRVKKILTLLGPGLIGYAAVQLNILATTILASSLSVGAISWLNYAFRLFQFPIGILSVSLANSNFTYFSEAWKQGNKAKSISLLSGELLLFLSSHGLFLRYFICSCKGDYGLDFFKGSFQFFRFEHDNSSLSSIFTRTPLLCSL